MSPALPAAAIEAADRQAAAAPPLTEAQREAVRRALGSIRVAAPKPEKGRR